MIKQLVEKGDLVNLSKESSWACPEELQFVRGILAGSVKG